MVTNQVHTHPSKTSKNSALLPKSPKTDNPDPYNNVNKIFTVYFDHFLQGKPTQTCSESTIRNEVQNGSA